MNEINIIPIFKKKELNIEYLSDSFEDENRIRLRTLWQTFSDYEVKLDISQIIRLMDYSLESDKYASQLMSLLKGKEFRDYLPSQMEEFKKSFSPKSMEERLIFNIFKNVCDEVYWADDILKMNEFKS